MNRFKFTFVLCASLMFASLSTGGFFAPAFAQRCENLPLTLDLIAYLGDTIEDYESTWIGDTCEDCIEDVVVRNNIAYITVRGEGLQIVDVSNSAMPVLLGTLPTSLKTVGIKTCNPDLDCGPATLTCPKPLPAGVDVDNQGYAYVADGATVNPLDCATGLPTVPPAGLGGLLIADVSTPSSPVTTSVTPASAFISSLTGLPGVTGAAAQDVVVRGKYAYVAGGSSGLQIYDVSGNPGPPVWKGSLTFPAPVAGSFAHNNAFSVCLSPNGKTAYVGYAHAAAGAPAAPPSVPLTPPCPSFNMNPSLDPSYFAANPTTGMLRVVNVSNPTAPTLLGSVELWGRSELGVDILQGGKYVCVAAYTGAGSANTPHGLTIVDVSTPATPTIVGFYLSKCFCPKAYQRLASVSDVTAGVVPACPPPIPPIPPFLPALNRFRTYIVNEVVKPLGGVPIDGTVAGGAVEHRARRVHVVGNRAYVAATMSGIQVFDVSDPTTPVLIGASGPSVSRDVFIAGDTAYVANCGGGLQIFDIH